MKNHHSYLVMCKIICMLVVFSTLSVAYADGEEEKIRKLNSVTRSTPVLIGESISFSFTDSDTDIIMAVKEVLHGQAAFDRIISANKYNEKPAYGMEYYLVTMHVETSGSSDERTEMDSYDFEYVSKKGKANDLSYALDIESDISLYSGGEGDFYLIFQTEKEDEPCLLYEEEVWFSLKSN